VKIVLQGFTWALLVTRYALFVSLANIVQKGPVPLLGIVPPDTFVPPAAVIALVTGMLVQLVIIVPKGLQTSLAPPMVGNAVQAITVKQEVR